MRDQPEWSPDGKYLLFSSGALFGFFKGRGRPLYDRIPQPYAELFVMKADGSEPAGSTDK